MSEQQQAAPQAQPPSGQQAQQALQQQEQSAGEPQTQSLNERLNESIAALENYQEGGEESAPAPEAKPEPTPPPVPKAAAFAALHRREQALAQKQMEWSKQRDAEMGQIREWESLKANGKRNPMAALRALGYEDGQEFLKQIAETGGKWTPEQQELAEIKSKLAEKEKQETEWRKQQDEQKAATEYRQKVDSWHTDIRNYAKSNDKWKGSLATLPGAEELAFQQIASHYEQTQETMQYDTALEQVTNNLRGQLTQTLEAVVATEQGRELLTELAKKLGVVQPPAQRGKQTPAHKRGLSGPIQQTNTASPKSRDDETLEERLAASSQWLTELSRSQQ